MRKEINPVRPKTPQNPLKIAAGSSLAIQGIFLEILRERFRDGNGLDWVWDEDPTHSGIIIETSYNDSLPTRNQAPAIYVTRTQTVPAKVAIGDRAGVNLPDHLEGYKALMRADMTIECVSSDEGESVIIGDIVQFTLLAAQDIIEREFGFHSFQHPMLGQTTIFSQDQLKRSTPVQFFVEFWIQWLQVPIVPLLQQIAQRVETKGQDLFKETVLDSMRRKT